MMNCVASQTICYLVMLHFVSMLVGVCMLSAPNGCTNREENNSTQLPYIGKFFKVKEFRCFRGLAHNPSHNLAFIELISA